MRGHFLKNINYIAGLLSIGALFGLAAFVANLEVKDLDLWLHLATGKFISEHYIPSTDVLSAAIQGRPWVNHEWLFQVIVYKIYSLFGIDGLLKMQAAIVVLTLLVLLFLGYQKDRQLLAAFGLFLVFLIYQQRFTLRPDLYSLFFFALYIYILALHIDKRWACRVLFVIQILWTNIHGFFFFGPLFVLIGVISEWIRRRIPLPWQWNKAGKLTEEEYQRLKKILFFAVLACFANPYFIQGALYPLKVFFSFSGENQIFFKYIQELKKPLTVGSFFEMGQFFYFKIMIFLSFLSFLLNRHRIDVSALILWLVFLVFSLGASRNVAFFALAGYLVIITNLVNFSFKEVVPLRFISKKFQYWTAITLKIFFFIWILRFSLIVSGSRYYNFDEYKYKSEFGGVSLRSYPDKAADFLLENDISGNFFNDFNSGAYLLGRCFPAVKVFIDGRTEVYTGNFFQVYQKIWEGGDQELFNKAVSQFNLTGAFLSSVHQHIPEGLLKYLYGHPDWALVYFDYDAVIFLRRIKPNEEWIQKFSLDLQNWEPPEFNFVQLGLTKVFPYRNYYRAFSLESLDLDEQALKEAQLALSIAPDYAEVYQLMGKIYAKRKDYRKAFEYFRLACQFSPLHKEMRFNLAMSYLDMGEYKEAVKQYEDIVRRWPKDPKGVFFLAKTYAENKQYSEAWKTLVKAHQMEPQDVKDLVKVGDTVFGQSEYVTAQKIYELALSIGKDSAIYLKLADVYEARGSLDQARGVIDQALSLDPDNQQLKERRQRFLQ